MLDSRRGLFVISGTQGAGKTTVASLLARRFERGVHIEADTLQKMVVSGGEWPTERQTSVNDEVRGQAGQQLRLRLRNMCLLGRSFYDAGFTAVLEDIIIGTRVNHMLEDLAGLEFMFVLLVPDVETIRHRELQRGTELWREWEWLTRSFLEAPPNLGLHLDSSAQTPEETVDEIMRRAWDEAAVGARP
jgi:chloramphenicol 3-O-phosphotransferase